MMKQALLIIAIFFSATALGLEAHCSCPLGTCLKFTEAANSTAARWIGCPLNWHFLNQTVSGCSVPNVVEIRSGSLGGVVCSSVPLVIENLSCGLPANAQVTQIGLVLNHSPLDSLTIQSVTATTPQGSNTAFTSTGETANTTVSSYSLSFNTALSTSDVQSTNTAIDIVTATSASDITIDFTCISVSVQYNTPAATTAPPAVVPIVTTAVPPAPTPAPVPSSAMNVQPSILLGATAVILLKLIL